MSKTADHATKIKMREKIERIAARCDASIPISFTEALRSLLAAMDYDDLPLIRSTFGTAMVTFATVVGEAVEKRLGWPQAARALCREIWDMLRECPVENLDEIGELLGSYFDHMLKILIDLRDGPIKTFAEKGYEVNNAAQLESDIKELQQMKMDILENWPWSNRQLPPVNTEMLKASMDAIARGEKGERIEDLIARLGGKPTECL